jgi:antitoxin MazE
MKAEIIKIGNSKGLRIPSTILKQCRMKNAVNLKVEDEKLIITPYEETRAGWEYNFQTIAKNNEDKLLDIGFIEHSWDEEEWQW